MTRAVELSDFALKGQGLHEALLFVNNKSNQRLYMFLDERGFLLDTMSELKKCARVFKLSDWRVDVGYPLSYDKIMAQVTKDEIAALGVTTELGKTVSNEVLLGANILTGLAYLNMKHNDGQRSSTFCTKNPEVVRRFASIFPIKDLEKGLCKHENRLCITEEELEGGYLNCVKFGYDSDGNPMRLKACRIYVIALPLDIGGHIRQ